MVSFSGASSVPKAPGLPFRVSGLGRVVVGGGVLTSAAGLQCLAGKGSGVWSLKQLGLGLRSVPVRTVAIRPHVAP